MANKIGYDGVVKNVPKEKLDTSQMPQSSTSTTTPKPQNLKELPEDINLDNIAKEKAKNADIKNSKQNSVNNDSNSTEGLKNTDYTNLKNTGRGYNLPSLDNVLPSSVKNNKYVQKARARVDNAKQKAQQAQKIQKTFKKVQAIAQAVGSFIAEFWWLILIILAVVLILIPLICAIFLMIGCSPHYYCDLDAPASIKGSKIYQQYCGGNAGGNEDIAQAAVSLAYELTDMDASKPHTFVAGICASTVSHSVTGKAGSNPADVATQLYVDVHKAVIPNDDYFASCDRGTCTAVRWAGADDDFPKGACPEIKSYLESHSDKWENRGKLTASNAEEKLVPGAVMISDGHVGIFVGEEAVHEKYPNSTNTTYAASLNDYCPQLQPLSNWTSGEYTVFVNIAPDEASKYKDIEF